MRRAMRILAGLFFYALAVVFFVWGTVVVYAGIMSMTGGR
jgi:hypothetical protein